MTYPRALVSGLWCLVAVAGCGGDDTTAPPGPDGGSGATGGAGGSAGAGGGTAGTGGGVGGVGGTAGAGGEPVSLDEHLVPSQGVLLGSSADYQAPEGRFARFANRETLIGRPYDIYHGYRQWTDAFPTAPEKELADRGTILLLNWKATNRPWAEIAAGDHDAEIDAAAVRFAAFGTENTARRKLMVGFHHEPEDDCDTHASQPNNQVLCDQEYAAAFRHVVERVTGQGVTNVVWVWNVMGFAGHLNAGRYDEGRLYPGDDVVDWIAYDPYNWFGAQCQNPTAAWQDFATVSEGFYTFATTNHPGKPLMLAEFGTEENELGSTPTKADWLLAVPTVLAAARPQIKAAVYFDTGRPTFCNWSIDSCPEIYPATPTDNEGCTNSATPNAFTTIAQDPYLNPFSR